MPGTILDYSLLDIIGNTLEGRGVDAAGNIEDWLTEMTEDEIAERFLGPLCDHAEKLYRAGVGR